METKEQEVQEHTHTEHIMVALSNIAGHLHMAQGWVDSLFPYRKTIHDHIDPKLMVQIIKASGECKILLKFLSKYLRNDDEAIDIMYEYIGRSVSLLSKVPLDKRKEMMERINEAVINTVNQSYEEK